METQRTTLELTFSFRDWRKGSELLERLGLTDELLFSDRFELTLEDWQEETLLEELQELDLEFDLQEKELDE